MQEVKSKMLTHIAYDPSDRRLEVVFTNGGKYTYDGVTPEEYTALMAAPSIGSYFAQNIRARYKGQKAD